jgi:hypothetical protein
MAPHGAALGVRLLRAGVNLAIRNISSPGPLDTVPTDVDISSATTERHTHVDPNDHAGEWLETLTGIRFWVIVLVAFFVVVGCIGCSTATIWWSGLPQRQAAQAAISQYKEDHARLLRECSDEQKNELFHRGSFSARCDRMFETAMKSDRPDTPKARVSLPQVKGIIVSIWGGHFALKDHNVDCFLQAFVDTSKTDAVDRVTFKEMMAYFEMKDRERAKGGAPVMPKDSPSGTACCAPRKGET